MLGKTPDQHPLSAALGVALLALLFCAEPVPAVDKSGVRPSVLSLPSGPGSIEGLGESFEPQLNSGTGSYAVRLAVPPGRVGFAPVLTLSYNGGSGNGLFGLGWRLSLPYLQRQTDKGLPFYNDWSVWPEGDGEDNDRDDEIDEFDELDVLVYSNGEELVGAPDGSFRFENEGEFLRFEHAGTGWTAKRPDGTLLRFGSTSASRVEDATGRIFRWCLDEMVDTHGNDIVFEHRHLDDSRQVYLAEIRYNPGDGSGMKVELVYEERPDIVTDFRPRFELKTAYRVSEVRMSAAGEPVRSYRFAYEPVTDLRPLSLLASITQVGRDGVSTLPPATFGYVPFEGEEAMSALMPTAPPLSLRDGDIDLFDINADGLPDVLDTRMPIHAYYLNLGPDETGVPRWGGQTFMNVAVSKFLSSPDVQLADMDGDGWVDLLDKFGTDSQYYRIGEDLSWEWEGFIGQPSFVLNNPNVRLLDVNNDKLIDVMGTGDFVYYTWLNLEQGRWSDPHQAISPRPLVMKFDRSYVRLADMNGDRLLDLVRLQFGVCEYYPALGFGQFGEGVTMANAPVGGGDASHRFMVDVNGDGMSDVLWVNGQRVSVWMNLGLDPSDHSQGRFAMPFYVDGPVLADSTTVVRQADVNGNGSTDVLWNTASLGNVFEFLDFAPGEQPYVLKTMANGIGKTTTLFYGTAVEEMVRDRQAGRPWPQGVPISMPVVRRIEVRDGLDPDNVYATEIVYHDGFYDGEEKEFRGFAGAERWEIGNEEQGAPTLVTDYEFDVGAETEALKGKPLAMEPRTVSGEAFYRETNTWEARTLFGGPEGDPREVVFAVQVARKRDVIEKGAGDPVLLEWEFDYDNYGNLIRQAEYGRVEDVDGSGTVGDSLEDRSAWDDERVTVATYTAAFESGRSAWILGFLVEREIQDETGAVFARKRNFYDDEAFTGSNFGEVIRGDLTMTLDWHDPADPNGSVRSVRNMYDEWGNAIRIHDPLWGMAPGHFREIVYDSDYHTFPVEELIHTGNPDAPVDDPTISMSVGYDAGFGVVTSSTDFNTHPTHYRYDTFGRLISIEKPYDSAEFPTVEYLYVLSHDLGSGVLVNWIETQQRENAGEEGTVDSRTFYDGLGRAVMTRAEGEDPGQVVVSTTVRFNARRQPWKQYLPYFDYADNLEYADPMLNTGFTEHQYDGLAREVKVYQPMAPGASHRVFSRITYQPMMRRAEDEEQTNPESKHFGCAMRYVEDGLFDEDGAGRLRELNEIVRLRDDGTTGPLTTWTTTYFYDVLDNLLGYLDAQYNRKYIYYDGLNRRIFINDPDRSWMWYAYDDASNLVRTRDAKGQGIAYTYDGLNRLQAEYYTKENEETRNDLNPRKRWSSSETNPERKADVLYHYDFPAGPVESGGSILRWHGADIGHMTLEPEARSSALGELPREFSLARNTVGLLSWVHDLSGDEHRSYDRRLRQEWIVKKIDDSNTDNSISFKMKYEHDSMNRLVGLCYPDHTRLTYLYNRRGLVESIPNVINRCNYNPGGQLAELEYSCGAVTRRLHDYRLRLKQLRTERLEDGLALQDLLYDYDDVSNITRITDNRNTTDLSQIATELGVTQDEPTSLLETQILRHDSLYRLIRAENRGTFDTSEYRYDRIGNIIFKSSSRHSSMNSTNLGEMVYGGSELQTGNQRAWRRDGRGPTDSPGPHAFTLSENGVSASYDANGNMTLFQRIRFGRDHKGRARELVRKMARTKYSYDYADRRITKATTGGYSRTSLYPFKEFEVRDGDVHKYIFLNRLRIARSTEIAESSAEIKPSSFLLHDHLGSISSEISANATFLNQIAYYAFGQVRVDYGHRTNRPYGFSDKERDEESGFLDFGGRLYSPIVGRFGRPDPMSAVQTSAVKNPISKKQGLHNPQELNSYSYTTNRPLFFVDPSGLKSVRSIIFWEADQFFRERNKESPSSLLKKQSALVVFGQLIDIGLAATVPAGYIEAVKIGLELGQKLVDLESTLKGEPSIEVVAKVMNLYEKALAAIERELNETKEKQFQGIKKGKEKDFFDTFGEIRKLEKQKHEIEQVISEMAEAKEGIIYKNENLDTWYFYKW